MSREPIRRVTEEDEKYNGAYTGKFTPKKRKIHKVVYIAIGIGVLVALAVILS